MKHGNLKHSTIAFIWDKQIHNPGRYTLSQCEICLVMKHGRIPSPRGARNERQFISAPRGKHSEKPEEVRKRIERMFPEHDRIELFARAKHRFWKTWGNEING